MSEGAYGAQLTLGNGVTWGIRACDAPSRTVVESLARTARLGPLAGGCNHVLRLRDPSRASTPDAPADGVTYDLSHGTDEGTATDVARAASVLAARTPGALLLHGALIARGDCGVILTGPGGYGKTTTARRMPPPWRALSDDASLVVPDAPGRFVAHPWPTWSRLIFEGSDETWDVQRWVPLDHIFFLGRSERDAVEPVGPGTALCLVLASVEQIRSYLPAGLVDAAQRLRDFDTALAVVKAVSTAILRFSPTGPVWLAVEDALSKEQISP